MKVKEKQFMLPGHAVTYLGSRFIVAGTWDDGTCDLMQDGLVVMYNVPLADVEEI